MKQEKLTKEENCEEDYQMFYKILKRNMNFKHPGNKLPKIPWFLKNCRNEQIAILLTKILQDSKFMINEFLDKATLLLLLNRSEKENQIAKIASLLKENVDIRERLKHIPECNDKSRGKIRLLESESELGPVTITLELAGEIRNLDIGEYIEGPVSLKSDIEIKVFVQVDGESIMLDEIYLYFGSALDDVYYLSLVDKPFFQTILHKGDERYKLKIELNLFLSNLDKREILLFHLYENETLTKQEQEAEDLYSALLSQLAIREVDDEYESAFDLPKSRDCCNCQVL